METEELEQHIYDLIVDICCVMYDAGYRSVPMGAVMRLIGVSEKEAAEHDGNMFELDEDFQRIMQERGYPDEYDGYSESDDSELDSSRPEDVTLH